MSEPRKELPRQPARTDAMGPTRVDPSLPGVTGSEAIHGNTRGFPYRDGEPEPEDMHYSGQGGVTGQTVNQAPKK
jgi:hypothetical protein